MKVWAMFEQIHLNPQTTKKQKRVIAQPRVISLLDWYLEDPGRPVHDPSLEDFQTRFVSTGVLFMLGTQGRTDFCDLRNAFVLLVSFAGYQ